MEFSDESVRVAHEEFDRCFAIAQRRRVPESAIFGLLSALKLLMMEIPRDHRLKTNDRISLCVSEAGARSKMRGVHYYVFSSPMEVVCVECEGESLYVTDPVTTCMQMSGYCPREEAAALFDTLVRRSRQDKEENEMALGDFLEESGGFKGKTTARWAFAHHRMNTDSSMESRLRLILTGARLPEPVTNPVFTDPESGKVWIPDMVYLELGMILEYQGLAWHSSPERLDNDSHKSLRFQRFGCEVIPVTNETLSIPWRRDEFLKSLKAIRRTRLRFSAKKKESLRKLFTVQNE